MTAFDRFTSKGAAIVASARDRVGRRWASGAGDHYVIAAIVGCGLFAAAALGDPSLRLPSLVLASDAVASVSAPQISAPIPSAEADGARMEHVSLSSASNESVAAINPDVDVAGAPILEYDVAYYWPTEPETVRQSTPMRARPEKRASIVRVASPGERLRINGRINVRGQDWLRARLPDGRDGYFLDEDTVKLTDFRRRRAATRLAEAERTVEPAALASPSVAPRPNATIDDDTLPLF